MPADAPAAVEAVARALADLGAAGRPVELPATADPGSPASVAAALGIAPQALVRTEVFTVDGRPVVVAASAQHRADPIVLAALLGAHHVEAATGHQVRSWTGQPIGAIAPVGHPHSHDTLVDVELATFRTVWCTAGDPRWVFPINYAELLRITAGEAAEVGDLSPTGAP